MKQINFLFKFGFYLKKSSMYVLYKLFGEKSWNASGPNII